MKVQKADVLYDEISRHNRPTLTVAPGEVFQVETELNTGGWLHSVGDSFTMDKITHHNPSSGCIFVKGASEADMLKISILDLQVSDLGYTGFGPGMTPIPDLVRQREWETLVTKTVRIEGDRVLWDDRTRIPIKPMIGVIGTAPSWGVAKNIENGVFGGNMDIQEVSKGNKIMLPVFVDGALLHVGDVHAVMGDGEICGAGGIETRGVVTLKIELERKPDQMLWPRIVAPTEIISVGCARPAEEAFRIALQEMIKWMVAEYDFKDTDAFLLLGQILEARCTQFVDPLYTYVCKVKTQYLTK
jgi:acetamidase/formamidase